MKPMQSALAPALATDISDRAFRLYVFLVILAAEERTKIPAMAAACGLKPYQVRAPLAELRDAGMVETERIYENGDHGRKTWRTYVQLTQDTDQADRAAS